jgi:hypothetical protein
VSGDADLPSARLRREFDEAAKTTRIGGASVLRTLSTLAGDCITGKNPSLDSVAFTLCTILGLHADDRDERMVTGDDTYRFMASGAEHLSSAVTFLETGGSAEEAVEIIAALAMLTPARIYNH